MKVAGALVGVDDGVEDALRVEEALKDTAELAEALTEGKLEEALLEGALLTEDRSAVCKRIDALPENLRQVRARTGQKIHSPQGRLVRDAILVVLGLSGKGYDRKVKLTDQGKWRTGGEGLPECKSAGDSYQPL